MQSYYDHKDLPSSEPLYRGPDIDRALRTQWKQGKQYAQRRNETAVVIADVTKSMDNVPANNFIVYTPTIHSQGTTATPTVVKITATKPDGTAASLPNHKLRARICNSGTYALSTNATIAVANATTELEDVGSTGDKDLVIQEAASAQLTTALSGSNNDLVYTAVSSGTAGNDITVAYSNPGTASASLSVSVSNRAITVNLATDAGTAQVETATVVAAAGATENATLHVTVTGAAVTGGSVIIPVALTTSDNTADLVATAIRAALNASTAITTNYTVGGSTAAVTLTRKVAAANDSTLKIEWSDAVAGVGEVTNSSNTTAGVAPAITSTAAQIKTAIEASTAASALVTVALASGNDGTGVVTSMAAANLAGGAAGDIFWLSLTDATAETVTLRLGPPPLGGNAYGDYSASLNVTHAAP